ncbi:MAG: YceI family protein [Caulobacteraceae bacterium]|nr:YceI family protein [Caulobacteraceae bacterium]
MNLRLAPIAAATALFAFPVTTAFAQTAPSTDPAKVPAGAYAVESSHTRVLFAINHMGFTTYYGDFTGVSGSLTVDPAKPAASAVSVSIPTASISTTNATLDAELKAADWLDAAKYPTITFKTTSVTPTGASTADVTGDLTLHGVTKSVTLAAKFNAVGPNIMTRKITVGFDGTAHIKRSDFGVTKYVPLIGDQVDVIISAAFEKVG